MTFVTRLESGSLIAQDFQAAFAAGVENHKISVITIAELMHHMQVAPMTKGSRKVR